MKAIASLLKTSFNKLLVGEKKRDPNGNFRATGVLTFLMGSTL